MLAAVGGKLVGVSSTVAVAGSTNDWGPTTVLPRRFVIVARTLMLSNCLSFSRRLTPVFTYMRLDIKQLYVVGSAALTACTSTKGLCRLAPGRG